MTTAASPQRRRRRARRRTVAALAFAGAALASGVAALVSGADQRLGGAGIGLGCVALGVALATWARHAHPHEASTEERHDRPPLPCLGCAGTDRGRRRAVLGAVATIAGATGVGLVVARTSGARRALRQTAWGPRAALVTDEGRVLTVNDVEVGDLVSAWPEGAVGAGDAQVVLLRLRPDRLTSDPRRAGWSPEGFVAYSRLCTHMGCPVGLYQQDPQVLVCPCHQAAFDVFDRARPVQGPAAEPLPQLPLLIDDDGVLRAQSDFLEPVGPAWWGAPS